jgi:hypothetical protein
VIAHGGGRIAQATDAIEVRGAELGERDGAFGAELERAPGVRDEQRSPANLREQCAPFDPRALLVSGETGHEPAAALGVRDRTSQRLGDATGIFALASVPPRITTAG